MSESRAAENGCGFALDCLKIYLVQECDRGVVRHAQSAGIAFKNNRAAGDQSIVSGYSLDIRARPPGQKKPPMVARRQSAVAVANLFGTVTQEWWLNRVGRDGG
jgi:hypothetical protein